MGGQLVGNLIGQQRRQPALPVDLGQLGPLRCRVQLQPGGLGVQRGPLGVGLRAHRNVLAAGHRQGAGHQTGDTSHQERFLGNLSAGHTHQQTRDRDDAVVGPHTGAANSACRRDGSVEWSLDR